MAVWVKPEFRSYNEVDRAGHVLVDPGTALWQRNIEAALKTVNNWRSSHSFPLNTAQVTLRNRAEAIDPNASVAQRLKRLPSIRAKLQRKKTLQLSKMQDIGGCRAVVRSIREVEALVQTYAGEHSTGTKVVDYIARPKTDGYRCVHVVTKYSSDEDRCAAWKGLHVEIQIRSRLQHAWATAVETVSTFTGNRLKSGEGDPAWRRFFVLVSTAFAIDEGCPLVGDTPTDRAEIARELRGISQNLKVEALLTGWRYALNQVLPKKYSGAVEHLLILDIEARKIAIVPFASRKAAFRRYLVEERDRRGGVRDVVLVSAASTDELKKVFPNYYSDTDVFLAALDHITGLLWARG